ncbi:MAG: hypothetical protein Q8O19_04190 [Rectinemataceae bacterium]|nr:hypothetical protein [Rectinemataceae bacterium]
MQILAPESPCLTAKQAEDKKDMKHGQSLRMLGKDFSGFGVEVYGALGPGAVQVFTRMVADLGSRGNFVPLNRNSNTPEREWLQKMAVTLHTGNAKGLYTLYKRAFNKGASRGRFQL